MKDFLRGLLHIGTAAGIATATNQVMSGVPLTSAHVLIPSIAAFAAAVLHSALPGLLAGLDAAAQPKP